MNNNGRLFIVPRYFERKRETFASWTRFSRREKSASHCSSDDIGFIDMSFCSWLTKYTQPKTCRSRSILAHIQVILWVWLNIWNYRWSFTIIKHPQNQIPTKYIIVIIHHTYHMDKVTFTYYVCYFHRMIWETVQTF